MKTKALLVGVRSYGEYGPDVEAAVDEMSRWAQVLFSERYGVDSVTVLANENATGPNILGALESLVKDVEPEDTVLFVFGGHGCKIVSDGAEDEALVAYPGGHIGEAILTGSKLAAALGTLPPRGTHFTMILDCCYSGELDISEAEQHKAQPLFIRDIDRFLRQTTNLKTMTSHAPVVRPIEAAFKISDSPSGEVPIILAAAAPDQLAYQVTLDGVPRLLFSSRMQETLAVTHTRPTYNALMRAIYPLRRKYPQKPTIRGNATRANDVFLGDAGMEGVQPAEALARAAATAAVTSINVRIDGICCWVSGREEDAFVRRLILPHDPSGDEETRHIAFVEIADSDIASVAGPGATVENYLHVECAGNGLNCEQPGTVRYSRWELSGHTISITTTAEEPALSQTDAFVRHVPQMKKILPELRAEADPECYSADPPPTLVAGMMDVTAGSLDIGTLEEFRTAYEPQRLWPPMNREPEFVTLRLPIASAVVKVSLIPFKGTGATTEITLKAGTGFVRIGNEQLKDITGPGSGENATNFFALYYNLSDRVTYATLPRPLPLPRKPLAPINACTNSTWP